jgi:hypothetical protein
MHLHGDPRGERAENGLLALKLIELAVAAGWKPRECIGFAREAHRFIVSTLPEPATGLVACSSKPRKETGRPSHPEWGPDSETRRNALQALADKNLTLREAAKILGIGPSLACTTASRLKVSFHGRRSRKLQPAARNINAAAKPKKRTAMNAPGNGEAAAKLLTGPAASPRMQRRCLSCKRIYEPAEISHPFCNDCEYGNSAPAGQP